MCTYTCIKFILVVDKWGPDSHTYISGMTDNFVNKFEKVSAYLTEIILRAIPEIKNRNYSN